MMYCGQSNNQLANQLRQAFKSGFQYKDQVYDDDFTSFDSDKIRYKISSKKDEVIFMFTCQDFESIWSYVKNFFEQRYYPDIKISVPGVQGYNCSLTINPNLVKTAGKDQLILRLSSFKRQLFAAPYEMMMRAVKEKKAVGNITFSQRVGDRTWISFDKNQFTVSFGLSFFEKSEQAFAKVLLTELMDAKKHVNNSPSVIVSESQLPQSLVAAFPKERNAKYQFTNGITTFTFFDATITNIEAQADMLGNFRQYVTYHVQASKCSLHAKIIKRIELFYKSLGLARIKPQDDK